MNFIIRPLEDADIPDVQAIYAHHVLTGTGTFELEPPDCAEIAQRVVKVAQRGCPWLVGVDVQGKISGYAYAGAFRERKAYDCTVEDSIYLAPDCIGKGLGRALLARLVEDCKARGYEQMLALIGDSANLASIGLHRSFGFEEVGTLRNVGHKFGRKLDVVILQKSL